MREFLLSLGPWGPLAVMPLLSVFMTVILGYRTGLGFSLRFGATCGFVFTVCMIIGTYTHALAGIALIVGALFWAEKSGYLARYGVVAKKPK